MAQKMNCWEFKKCGRDKDNSCVAVAKGNGASCWLSAGTMCGGKTQGSFAEKIGNCRKCDFYLYAHNM